MKKLLLILGVILSIPSSSQVFWGSRPTGFANNRGVLNFTIAPDNLGVWLEAYDGAAPTNAILEYARSADGGNTWLNGAIGIPTTSTVCSFQAMSATTCYAGASASGLYRTTNGGTSWSSVTTGLFSGTTSFFDFGAFTSPEVGVTVGDPLGGYMEIYRTTNASAAQPTWTRIPLGSFSLPIETGEYAFTGSYEILGNTIWFLTNKARTYRSNDAGLTWEVFSNPLPATDNTPGGKTCFKSATEGLLYNGDYSFWSTTDGGANWVEILPTGTVRGADISFVPGTANTYVSIGVDADLTVRGTSYSTDGGLTWENINLLGDPLNVNGTASVEFSSPTMGLCSGFNTTATTGIFKYVGTILPNKSFSETKYFTASPNPTSGVLNLSGENIASLSVNDILGKEIANVNYSSLDTVSLDMTSYNVGVYMVKITNADGNTSTIKVVRQ